MTYQVYIPTIGRVGPDRQVSLRQFLTKSSHVPVLVCPPTEAMKHRWYAPKVLACRERGIGPTRQWILDTATEDVVIMCDDDMRFAHRPNPADPKLVPCTNLTPMLDVIVRCVRDGYTFGGVCARQGNNRIGPSDRGVLDRGHLFVDCTRVNNFHYFDRSAVKRAGVLLWHGDPTTVMEDFFFTLSMFTRGYPNRVVCDYVWNQRGSGASGGCSLYRTAEVQDDSARKLQAVFPQFVRVVTKHSKSVWGGMESRTDVVVSWLKAYQSSQRGK